MVKHMFVVVVGVMGMLSAGGITTHAPAQTVVAAAVPAADFAQSQSKTPDVLSRTLTISLVDVSLESALSEIVSNTGVRLVYSRQALPMERKVSVRGTNISLSDALAQALRGTSAEIRSIGEATVALRPSPAPSKAAQGVIAGKVVHAVTKQPLGHVTITLDDGRTTAVTGPDGTFRISAAPGERKLKSRAVGYSSQVVQVNLREGETVQIEIVLDPNTSVLEEVVVTGTIVATERKAITTPITVITASEIEKRGITRIEQLFRGEVPGVIAIDKGSRAYRGGDIGQTPVFGEMVKSDVYARGSADLEGAPNPLKTFIDGVELVDPSYLGTIDPKSIERIEIIVGPQASTIYGSGARGGVMQIFTKRGGGMVAPEINLSLKYGILQSSMNRGKTPSHDHGLQLSGGGGPIFTYTGTASHNYTGQWQPLLFSSRQGASAGVSHSHGPVDVRGAILVTQTSNGTAQDPINYRRKREAGEWQYNQVDQPGIYLLQRVALSSSQMISLNIDYRTTSFWSQYLTLGKSLSDFALRPERPRFMNHSDTLFNQGSSRSQLTSVSYNSTLNMPASRWLSGSMTLGGNRGWTIGSTMYGCTVTAKASLLLPCSVFSSTSLNASSEPARQTWGGFGRWQLGIAERLYLNFGLRAERSATSGRRRPIDWTPTNGAAYTMEIGDLTVKFLGSYGRSMKSPPAGYSETGRSTDPNYSPLGFITRLENPDLRPEYSRGPQGGFEAYYGNRGSFSLNTVNQTVTDLIQRVPVDTIEVVFVPFNWTETYTQTMFLNTAKIRQRGWEGTGSLNLGPLSVRGTYSWTDNRIIKLNPEAYAYWLNQGSMFYGVPSHYAFVGLGYARGSTSISLTTNYVGPTIQDGGYSMRWVDARYLRIKTYVDAQLTDLGDIVQAGYYKSDLAVSHRMSSWATATVNMTNLGNRYASDVSEAHPSLGRQTLFGVSLRRRGR